MNVDSSSKVMLSRSACVAMTISKFGEAQAGEGNTWDVAGKICKLYASHVLRGPSGLDRPLDHQYVYAIAIAMM